MQWWDSPDDISYSEITGATGQNYSPGTLIADRYYKRVIHSGTDAACKDTSDAFYIEVYPLISNNIIETDSTRYCAGDIPDLFTGTSPAGGDEPDYFYTWQVRELTGSWTNISGATGEDYTPSTIYEDTVLIRRMVESGLNLTCSDNSNSIQIDVIPYILNDLVTPDSAVCEGAVPLPFVETVATGGAGIDGYLWQSQLVSGGTWETAPGTYDQPAYASGTLTQSTRFRRLVTSQICTDYSDTITTTVYPSLVNNSIIGSPVQYTCYNSSKELEGNPALEGGMSGDLRFIWEDSPAGIVWDQADGVNDQVDYTSSSLTDTLFFRRIVLSGENDQCMDTTDAVLVRINSLPSGDIVSSTDTACAGDYITVQYENLSGALPWTLVLAYDDSDIVHTETGITSASGEFNVRVPETGLIRVIDIEDDSTCHADLSSNTGGIDLTVFEVPVAFAGADTQVCGPVCTLNAVPSAGTGTWSGSGASFINANDFDTDVEIQTYGSHIFTWKEENWQCSDEDDVEITFYQRPESPYAGEDQSLDYDFHTYLDADPPAFGNGFWKFVTGSGTLDDSTAYNAYVEFPELGTYELLWTVTNGVCEPVSDAVSVVLNDLKVYGGFSPNRDALNPTFYLKLSGREPVELFIFDRWGNQIYYQKETDEISWDGTVGDDKKPVPEGTYFYIIKDPSGGDPKKGSLELRR